jgi:hypothetical protein
VSIVYKILISGRYAGKYLIAKIFRYQLCNSTVGQKTECVLVHPHRAFIILFFLSFLFSDNWVGNLRLLVAPNSDTQRILSQCHNIFSQVWQFYSFYTVLYMIEIINLIIVLCSMQLFLVILQGFFTFFG